MQRSASVQSLYLGRSPPMFTEMRVLRQSTNDDHLVCTLESGMIVMLWHLCSYLLKWFLLSAGFGVGDEFSYCRRYECNTCCETEEKIGFWNLGKVAFDGHAHWREGESLIWFFDYRVPQAETESSISVEFARVIGLE